MNEVKVMPPTNILGQRIKILRLESNLTQEQFGRIFGLSKSTISQYETGLSRPDDELKDKIALYFNVSIDWLLGRTDERLPAHLIKEEATKYNVNHDPFIDDLLKKVPDLTDKEKESLKDHMEFAMKLIEKERKERAKENK